MCIKKQRASAFVPWSHHISAFRSRICNSESLEMQKKKEKIENVYATTDSSEPEERFS